MKIKFFVCETCGKVIAVLKDSGVPTICCGKPMKELIPGTTDASPEKHVPVYTVNGDTVNVCVGAAMHPMTPEHLIEWIALHSSSGIDFRMLSAGQKPCAAFRLLEGETIENVYAYCNIHGLWKV